MDDNPSLRRLNKLANINLIDLSNNAKQQQIFNDILNLLSIRLREFPPGHNSKKCSGPFSLKMGKLVLLVDALI